MKPRVIKPQPKPTMGDRAYATPREGLRVIDPKGMQPLPAQGKRIKVDQHWLRRLKCGDVALSFEPATLPKAGPIKVDSTSKDSE